MLRKEGKSFGNAEVEIDYKKKSIGFNYNNKEPNENLSFFTNSLFAYLGLIWFFPFLVIFFKICFYDWSFLMNNSYGFVKDLIIALSFSVLGGGVLLFSLILFGYISLFCHKNFEYFKKTFPVTNGVMKYWKKKRKIDLSKEKLSNKHLVEKNRLIIFDYDIRFFDFWYIGDNKISVIETKSVEKQDYKGEHMKYVAFFYFEKLIEDGIFIYR